MGSIVLSNMFTGDLERAILEALVYSDIFEYPLRLDELQCYLPMAADLEQLSSALNKLGGTVGKQDDVYFLIGREEIVDICRQREARSRALLPRAMQYGRILGSLPFIRMVALTGSLAVLNVSKAADFDYMLVTKKGRVWTARAFALLLNRIAKLFGHTLCPNLIVSEQALEWSLHDLYSARELCQMIPIAGMDVYHKLINANEWAKEFLPNSDAPGGSVTRQHDGRRPSWSRLFELPMRGKLGDKFEAWEMQRKIARFSKQAGFGEETVFNAEVCQGNFHHHRKWTREVFEEKIRHIVIANPERSEWVKQSPTWAEIASSPIGSSQ